MIHAERHGLADPRLDRERPKPTLVSSRWPNACWRRRRDGPGEGGVKLAVGSHNVRSIAYAMASLEKHDLPQSALEVQNLYGMADPLHVALGRRGVRLPLLRALGRNDPRHGLSGAAAAGEYVEPIVVCGPASSRKLPDEVLLASPQNVPTLLHRQKRERRPSP